MMRDVGFANPHAFCIFAKGRGKLPLLETASELFAVLDIWWKIVGLASFIFSHTFHIFPL